MFHVRAQLQTAYTEIPFNVAYLNFKTIPELNAVCRTAELLSNAEPNLALRIDFLSCRNDDCKVLAEEIGWADLLISIPHSKRIVQWREPGHWKAN